MLHYPEKNIGTGGKIIGVCADCTVNRRTGMVGKGAAGTGDGAELSGEGAGATGDGGDRTAAETKHPDFYFNITMTS